MQWAQRRRYSIATGIVLILASLTALTWYFFIYEPPSCSDGIQNQDERGIDCEGACVKMCTIPRVDAQWTRAIETADGVYHGASLVKNPEPGARGSGLSYSMSLYDSGNILVAERRGTFDLAPGETRVIFEPNIITGERTPVRALLKVTGGSWERAEPRVQEIRILPGALDQKARTFSATLENTTPRALTGVIATALLFDDAGVLVTVSETKVPVLDARTRQEVTFTWSIPFARPVSTSDIVVRYDADR